MVKVSNEQLQRHIKNHTERSVEDKTAVTTLQKILSYEGKIISNFSWNDKWPNIDGTFELVTDPEVSRQPKQNFVVQIKGTENLYTISDNIVKYQLKSLAFPAYVATEVTLDPSILFVVINNGKRNKERVFWKYISPQFIASIDFSKDSTTIRFSEDEEIKDTDESLNEFVKKIDHIADTHSYVKQLESREYNKEDVKNLILARCNNISESVDNGGILNYSCDKLSRKILTELEDLCKACLMINGLQWHTTINLRTAWELALINIDTKFLATFLQGLRYIGLRVPEDGQYERLMFKYYGFLWKIRKYLKDVHALNVLENLEKLGEFLLDNNEEDKEYNKIISRSIESVTETNNSIRKNRYYVQKKTAFYVGAERYFEITLQLANKYATKYNRLTAYTKIDISTNYSIQVGYTESQITLWDNPSKIKVITNWKVSVEPSTLNKLSRILRIDTKISSNYSEYSELMNFLTKTGINLLDFIDLRDERFNEFLNLIYEKTNTNYFKSVLIDLHKKFNESSTELGRYSIRYALIRLREDLVEDILPVNITDALQSYEIYLSKKCYPFEMNPILYNLPKKKTNGKTISKDVLRSIGKKSISNFLPYIRMKYLIDSTGELFFRKDEIEYVEGNQTINNYNSSLRTRDIDNGCKIKEDGEYVYLDEYVKNTIFILKSLLNYSSEGNDGQEQLNKAFIDFNGETSIDEMKIFALKSAFVDSKVMMIYGAAGTGKTTLMDYISNLMDGRSKLFLTKTHTAKDNLKRRIKSPGSDSDFMVIDQFIKLRGTRSYDIVFVDECSTIDNRTMLNLLEKIDNTSLLVLAGDIYQIESIEFGNWFFYAKDILPEKSIVELNNTWRTQEKTIKELWEAVRFKEPLITEMLVIDGPFSENIGENLFEKNGDDEVVLCLNYDGKFGLNSINNYFQDANPSSQIFQWGEWKYKIGDRVLFNGNQRFHQLYNNLKGNIVDIQSDDSSITFTIDVDIILTALDFLNTDLKHISTNDKTTRIKFTVYSIDESKMDEAYEESRLKSIVPFQLAYAVSIHKAQGLEYDSIKVVIPNSNSERISHGIFYTAITRTKKNLKIYWSSDTMEKVISSFNESTTDKPSLDIIKRQLDIS